MSSLKPIAIISNTSWGIINYRSTLINAIQQIGYEVITVAPIDEYTDKLRELGCTHLNIDMDSNSRNPIKDVLSILKYVRLFKKINPSVVLNYTAKPNIYSTLACSWCGLPSVNNISGLGYGFVNETLITKILRILYKTSLNKASFVFFQNPDDYQIFRNLKIVEATKSQILPGSGVNLERFRKCQIPDISTGPFVFLLVSRMMYSKGIEILIQAGENLNASGYKNFEIHLLGDKSNNNVDAIPNSIIKTWTSLSFVKYMGKSDNVFPFFEKAHCVVLPSYYKEGTPRSLLEGLAVGRPIITTDTAGCKETVTDGINGFLVPPKSVDKLAGKMKEIVSFTQVELQKMGDESHKKAESQFNEQYVINAYLKKINELALK